MWKQPLQDLQDVLQGGAQQRVNHRWQGFGGGGSRAVWGGWHLPHGCHKVTAADGDGGNIQQEFLRGAVYLWVATTQSTQRRLGAHRPDVCTTVTWKVGTFRRLIKQKIQSKLNTTIAVSLTNTFLSQFVQKIFRWRRFPLAGVDFQDLSTRLKHKESHKRMILFKFSHKSTYTE